MASSNFITDLCLTVSLSFFSLMSLTNDTLIHSLPYFCGPGVSVLMHLGWRASPPGPGRRSHTWESAPLLRMLFAQIAPFVFEYEMHFPNMTGDRIYPLREQLRCEGIFYSSARLPLHLLFAISCKRSFTCEIVWKTKKSNRWCQIVIVQWISIGLVQVIGKNWIHEYHERAHRALKLMT